MARLESPVLKDLKLEAFYRAPLVYDKVLEVNYPDSIYAIKNVYGVDDPRVKVNRFSNQQQPSASSSPAMSSTEPNDQMDDPDAELVAKQKRVLSELKTLREEVDTLEKLLHKEKKKKDGPSKTYGSSISEANSGPSLQDKLKGAAGNKTAMQDIVLKHESTVLSRLHQLHHALDNFGKSSMDVGSSSSSKSQATVARSDRYDFVIFADPKHPPMSFCAVPVFLSRYGKVVVNTYVHSSIEGVPDKLKLFLSLPESNGSRYDAKYSIALIWKNVGKEPVLDPAGNCVTGEVNIIRHILQMVDKDAGSADKATETNRWFEIATKLSSSSPEELKAAMADLDTHLEKSPFLLGEEPHILDALLHSVLHQTDKVKSLSTSMTKWLKSLIHV